MRISRSNHSWASNRTQSMGLVNITELSSSKRSTKISNTLGSSKTRVSRTSVASKSNSPQRQQRRKSTTPPQEAARRECLVASKSNSPQRQQRRRLNYSSGGLRSAASDVSLPLQPVLETTHDDDDDDQMNVKVSSTYHPMKMRQEIASERVKPVLVDEPESKPVRGAGANVFAIQDAGTQQMMADECAYLCSTLSAYSAAQLKYGRRKTQSVASMARRIRQHLLQQPQAMQAVGQLIVDDPVTRRVLLPGGEQQEVGEMILEPASQQSACRI